MLSTMVFADAGWPSYWVETLSMSEPTSVIRRPLCTRTNGSSAPELVGRVHVEHDVPELGGLAIA